jgi:glycosyltransferase involved in cell wall biosynthesis
MIDKTIQSIVNQTYKNIELIIIDDGSTDNTEDVVRQNAHGARYFWKPNGGCSSALNVGIRKAEGDSIAFLGSDDQFTLNAIESLVAEMEKSEADFVYSPSIEVNVRGDEMLHLPAAPGCPDRFAREHFLTMNARACCVLYRKHVFDKFIFNESARYNEDSDFLQRVAINFEAAYCPTPTAKVFQHGGNKSSNKREISLALIKSYDNLLNTYPAFAESLGKPVDKRLSEIETNYIEALIEDKEFKEAEQVVAGMKHAGIVAKVAIGLHSTVPFSVVRKFRLALRIVKKHCGRIMPRENRDGLGNG